MKSFPLILILVILLSFISCNSEPDVSTVLIAETKTWVVDNEELLNFEMLGTNSEILEFEEDYSRYSIVTGTSSSGLFDKYIEERECYNQSFSINEQLYAYQVSLESTDIGLHGNIIVFVLYDIRWAYDITYNRLYYVASQFDGNYNSKYYDKDNITSTYELLDSVAINNVVCDSVMHFVLNDFEEEFVDTTVTELYYAKHIGLVKFVEHGGNKFERVWE